MKLPVKYNTLSQQEKKQIREQYIKEQKEKCWYCFEKLDGPPTKEILALHVSKGLYPEGFFKHPIHLHHDHNTGMTLGAVHCYCNAVLWEYENQ